MASLDEEGGGGRLLLVGANAAAVGVLVRRPQRLTGGDAEV